MAEGHIARSGIKGEGEFGPRTLPLLEPEGGASIFEWVPFLLADLKHKSRD